jgi:hypothetical protein
MLPALIGTTPLALSKPVNVRSWLRGATRGMLDVFKAVPLFKAGQNLLPIRNRAMVVTQQDE